MNRHADSHDKEHSRPQPARPPRNPTHSAKNQRSQHASANQALDTEVADTEVADTEAAETAGGDAERVEGEGSYTASARTPQPMPAKR
jgi:hypothetical protein